MRLLAARAIEVFGPLESPPQIDNSADSAQVASNADESSDDEADNADEDDASHDAAANQNSDQDAIASSKRKAVNDSDDSDDSQEEEDDDDEEEDDDGPEFLHHGLSLKSAYPAKQEQAPRAATCMRKDRWDQKWVDYIFHSPQLQATRVLEVPHNPRKTLSPFGLPTSYYGSDHICLAADLQFLDVDDNEN